MSLSSQKLEYANMIYQERLRPSTADLVWIVALLVAVSFLGVVVYRDVWSFVGMNSALYGVLLFQMLRWQHVRIFSGELVITRSLRRNLAITFASINDVRRTNRGTFSASGRDELRLEIKFRHPRRGQSMVRIRSLRLDDLERIVLTLRTQSTRTDRDPAFPASVLGIDETDAHGRFESFEERLKGHLPSSNVLVYVFILISITAMAATATGRNREKATVALGALFLYGVIVLVQSKFVLRTVVTLDVVKVSKGPWHTQFRTDEIQAAFFVDVARSGLRITDHAAKFNGESLWSVGRQWCVRIALADGSMLRIDSDRPKELVASLLSARDNGGGPSGRSIVRVAL